MYVPISVFIAVASVATAASDVDLPQSSSVVLVEVNGGRVTLADLEQKRASALFQARTAYYEAERKIIQDYVDDYLLEQQAKKEGITVAELLDRHVNATLPKDPTDDVLRVYYEGVDTTEPFEAIRGKIVEALRQRRMAKAKLAYLQVLRAQGPIVIRLAPPRAPVSMKDVPVRGATKPEITLLEFADYECAYCQQMQPALDKLEAEFKGRIAFAYKDFPLPMHPNAEKAAEAARCAGAQGKYWDYHDLLFAAKQLDTPALKAAARNLKLDGTAFDTCLDSNSMAEVVKQQATEAQTLGIQGTPTLLVNGRYVSGAPSYESVRAVILEELSSMGHSAGASANAPAPRPQGRELPEER
jgi:protein-disulfide isomerase